MVSVHSRRYFVLHFVRREHGYCPLYGAQKLSASRRFRVNAMLNSIRVIDFVRCTEAVRFSECPLWEVPLYIKIFVVRLSVRDGCGRGRSEFAGRVQNLASFPVFPLF